MDITVINFQSDLKKSDGQLYPLFPDHFKFSGNEARLIKDLGNRLLECCPSISPLLFRAAKNEDIESLFGLPSIYSNPTCMENTLKFQEAFFLIRRFPITSFFAEKSSLVALFSTSIVTKIHFFDLLINYYLDLINRSEIEEDKKVCQPIPDFALIIALSKDKKIEDFNFISHVIQLHLESANNSSNDFPNLNSSAGSESNRIFSELFQRLRDDIFVIGEVRNYLGRLTPYGDLRESSIPKLFESFLKSENYEPFDQLRGKKLFSVPDTDLIIDNDFISGFFSLLYTMKAIETNEESYFENIEFHIKKIESATFLKSLSIDIFSLLFLTRPNKGENEKEEFFVDKQTAEKILGILIDSDITDNEEDVNQLSPHLSTALRKIQHTNVLFPDERTVRVLMEPEDSIFALALEKKEIGIFVKIASKESKSTKLNKFISVAKEILEFQRQPANYEKFSADSKIEIICSFDLSKDVFDRLYSDVKSGLNDSMKTILDAAEKHIKGSSAEQTKIIHPYLLAFYNEVFKHLEISSLEREYDWTPLLLFLNDDIVSEKSYLYMFLSYLDTLVPPLLAAKKVSVAKCLNFDPIFAVSQLVDEGKIDQASSLASTLGYSVIEAIILSGSKSPKSLEILSKENPALSSCVIIESNIEIDEISMSLLGNSHTLYNFVEARANNDDIVIGTNDILTLYTFDSENQNGALKEQINTIILSLLRKNPVPTSDLADVLFRVTEDEFIDLLMNTKELHESFDLNKLNSLLSVSKLAGFLRLESIIQVFIDISNITNEKPFPLENRLSELLLSFSDRENSMSTASQLCENCHSFFNVTDIIQKAIIELYSQNKIENICQILKFDSKIVSELFERLPKEILDKVNSLTELNEKEDQMDQNGNFETDFFSCVPETWSILDTPIETIYDNVKDTPNVLRLFSEFPSIQDAFNEDVSEWISKQAENSVAPIDKRALTIAQSIGYFLPLMKNLSLRLDLVNFSIKLLLSLTSQLSSYDSFSEYISYSQLRRIITSLKIIHKESLKYQFKDDDCDAKLIEISEEVFESSLNKLNISYSLINNFPCAKYKLEYSFQDFDQKSTGESLAELCFKIDLIKLAEEFAKAWKIDNFDTLRDEYAINCAKIGVDNISSEKYLTEIENKPSRDDIENTTFSVRNFAADRRSTQSTLCTSPSSFSTVRKFIDVYRHLSFFDYRLLKRLTAFGEIEQILHYEFQPLDLGEYFEKPKEQQASGASLSASPSKPNLLERIFKSRSRESISDIPDFIDDNGELPDRHFFARIEHLCHYFNRELKTRNDMKFQESDRDIQTVSEVLESFDNPSTEISECLFPGTPSLLSHYLSARAPFFEDARYRCSVGEFEVAFNIFEKNSKENCDWTCFFNDLLTPAIERGRQGLFFSRANGFTSPHSSIQKMIVKTLEVAGKIPFVETAALSALGCFELAAYSSIEFSRMMETNDAKVKALNLSVSLQRAFEEEKPDSSQKEFNEDIEKVERYQELKSSFYANSGCKSREDAIAFLKKALPLQQQFCTTSAENYSVFGSKAGLESMIIYLLWQLKDFKLAADLIVQFEDRIELENVASNLVGIFNNEKDDVIKEILNGFQNVAPLFVFSKLALLIARKVREELSDAERIIAILAREIKSEKFRCAFAIQYGYFEDALAAAKSSEIGFLPLIAKTAARENNLQAFYETMKVIEKVQNEL